jgi:hypothetical protein
MRAAAALLAWFALAPGAAAQQSIALAIEGWRIESRKDITYFRCASQDCADGSVVSLKPQPHRTTMQLAEFEQHHRGLAEQNKGAGRIRDVRIKDAGERILKGVRVLQVSREVDWADNTTTFTIESRLIGPDRSFSLVSDSPRREWTASNFEGFLRRMVDIAGIKSVR